MLGIFGDKKINSDISPLYETMDRPFLNYLELFSKYSWICAMKT